MPQPAGADVSDEFMSAYAQLMSLTTIGGGLSARQEQALRDLDGIMVVAEHVLQGLPVGAGAHSTICSLLMDAYAKGRLRPDGEPGSGDPGGGHGGGGERGEQAREHG